MLRRFTSSSSATTTAFSNQKLQQQHQILVSAKRSYVHAFLRPPMKSHIPSFATHRYDAVKGTVLDSDMNTVEVRRDDFMAQYNDLINVLKNSSLADSVHLLPELGYFESIKPADLMTNMGDTIMPMPAYGMEHRRTELIDTIRYIRQCGAPNETIDLLQLDDKAHCFGSDIVLLPNGFLIGVTSRTNTIAAGILQGTYSKKEESKLFPTVAANLPNLNIPMMDIVGFAGQSIIIVWDNPDGLEAAAAVQSKASRPWNFVKIEPGCYFVALSGSLPRYDIIVDSAFPRSIELLQKAGLRVLPIDWTEPKKLGIGMRALILVVTFAKGGFSGGGVFTSKQHVRKGDQPSGKNTLTGKRSGAEGSPLYGQLISGELPPPVFQPIPRYNPPMHKVGPPVVIDEFDTDFAGNVNSRPHMEYTGGFDHSKEGAEKWQLNDVQDDGRRYRPGWKKR